MVTSSSKVPVVEATGRRHGAAGPRGIPHVLYFIQRTHAGLYARRPALPRSANQVQEDQRKVLGVTRDNRLARKFREKDDLPFDLISDA
jgi:peroxiredoxin